MSEIFNIFNSRYSNIISCATVRSNDSRGLHFIADDKVKHGKEALL